MPPVIFEQVLSESWVAPIGIGAVAMIQVVGALASAVRVSPLVGFHTPPSDWGPTRWQNWTISLKWILSPSGSRYVPINTFSAYPSRWYLAPAKLWFGGSALTDTLISATMISLVRTTEPTSRRLETDPRARFSSYAEVPKHLIVKTWSNGWSDWPSKRTHLRVTPPLFDRWV